MLEVKFYDSVDDSLLKFAVIVSQSNGKWVFCKHKERDTYEVPGPRYNIQRQGRIEGVGDFVVNIEMKNDVIKDVEIKGDYFLVGDIGQQVIAPLIDRHLTKEDLEAALPDRLDDVILNMKKADFVGLLLNK